MGIGVVIISIPIAELIAKNKVEDLKKEINDIVNIHKQVSQQIKRITEDLQKLDLNELRKKLNSMNQGLTQNLRTILTDQQTKLEIIKKIDPTRTGENPQTMLSAILEILNVVATIFTAVEIMCATNPATIAITGVLMVLNSIISIFSLINDIKEIKELNEKKSQLLEYFKSGGKFQQDKKAIADLSFQVVENFYMVVVNFKSMLAELTINIHLYSLSKNSKKLNYLYYLDMIRANPFDDKFQQKCLEVYKKFASIQNHPLDQKVNMSCKYLDDFENQNRIIYTLEVVVQIAQTFVADSDIGKELEKFSLQAKKLTTLKGRYQGEFTKRKSKSREDLPKFDKELLQDLIDDAKKVDEKEHSVAEIVSFYSTEFFADDPSGNTLFGFDLKELYQDTELLNYLGVNSKGQNVIYLPKPQEPALLSKWHANQQFLQSQYCRQNPGAQYAIKSMYIRMQASKLNIGKKDNTKLNYFYGLQIKNYNKDVQDSIERPAIDNHLNRTYEACMQVQKIQRREVEDEDLEPLCKYMCFFINAIAYPERVVNLHISKVENKYKAVLEWKRAKLRPEFFGKIIKYSIDEGDIMQEKEAVLYTGKVAGDSKSVLFSTK